MSTTIGVMHNLPVLWLAVGLLPIGHALVFSNSGPVEGGTIAVRGSCSAVRRVCTRSVKQAAMAAGVGGSESPALL